MRRARADCRARGACVLGLLFGLALPLGAAEPESGTAPPAAPSAVIVDRDHRLGPGDVLEISVNALPDLTRTVRLFRDGTLDFPLAGTVSALGLTVEELATRLTETLKTELRRPSVRVILRDVYVPPMPTVTVLGAVTHRGVIELPRPKPLRTVLAEARPTETADLGQVRVRDPEGRLTTLDFSRFNQTGEASGDILLKGGEEIVVLERPTATKPDTVRVTVLGAIEKPGSVEAEVGIPIVDVIEKAGGARPGADLERVTVRGPGHRGPALINVERYINGDTSAGYRVQSGDEIVVPEKPLRVLVFGEVQKPGEVAVGAQERVLNVYLAAGVTPNADLARAELIRRGADGKPVKKTLNLREAMKGKDGENVALRGGDVLFIPGKRGPKRGIVDYLGTLTSPLWLLRGFVGR